jgi:hypothetical protein
MLLGYAISFAQAIMFPAALLVYQNQTHQSVGAFSNMFGFGII